MVLVAAKTEKGGASLLRPLDATPEARPRLAPAGRPSLHDPDCLGNFVLAAHVPRNADLFAGLQARILEGLGQRKGRSVIQNKAHRRSIVSFDRARGVL